MLGRQTHLLGSSCNLLITSISLVHLSTRFTQTLSVRVKKIYPNLIDACYKRCTRALSVRVIKGVPEPYRCGFDKTY